MIRPHDDVGDAREECPVGDRPGEADLPAVHERYRAQGIGKGAPVHLIRPSGAPVSAIQQRHRGREIEPPDVVGNFHQEPAALMSGRGTCW